MTISLQSVYNSTLQNTCFSCHVKTCVKESIFLDLNLDGLEYRLSVETTNLVIKLDSNRCEIEFKDQIVKQTEINGDQ